MGTVKAQGSDKFKTLLNPKQRADQSSQKK